MVDMAIIGVILCSANIRQPAKGADKNSIRVLRIDNQDFDHRRYLWWLHDCQFSGQEDVIDQKR
jgi:hypothetical protein